MWAAIICARPCSSSNDSKTIHLGKGRHSIQKFCLWRRGGEGFPAGKIAGNTGQDLVSGRRKAGNGIVGLFFGFRAGQNANGFGSSLPEHMNGWWNQRNNDHNRNHPIDFVRDVGND